MILPRFLTKADDVRHTSVYATSRGPRKLGRPLAGDVGNTWRASVMQDSNLQLSQWPRVRNFKVDCVTRICHEDEFHSQAEAPWIFI
jgi:hypothetical protein